MALKKLAFIGAGSMAEAIISGLCQKKKLSPDQIYVANRQDESRLVELKDKYGVQCHSLSASVVKDADVIILAMKPSGAKEALESISPFTSKHQLFISVLAGITTDYVSYILGHKAPIVRVMPNTSASVGSSTTIIAPGRYVKNEHLQTTASFFESVGIVKHVKEEEVDRLTAIAGSGPAYMYYFYEAMMNSLKELKIDPELGEELVLQMMQGSIDLLKHTTESPRELYEKVRSPGGTTEAGLQVLANHDLQRIVSNCIKRAAERSQEITKEMSTLPENTRK
ncbi:pyrroline-5-carboxylate reductase [Alkalihalobacillus sp. MEB130]|uniref:pyrroline-5-carboxylate reductase n=1 Tax=Alkalihalobacillus sp. MEB130 TaxID=2976704 RepID=UPI0028DE6EE1|nr:pyrroline-5-carboxylate reductase [Alkalihalobacillus sp. MEB130]MDT8859674.1 pyrroline-5-carboxylate reductase [Alkalihalobacillus sp. MEB130]